jgi:CheY-like chemotaxis protein
MSKILLVEDGLIIAFHLRKLLEDNGHEVIANLTNGEEVFDHVEKSNPELIILDIMLKGQMNGVEAAQELRKISNTPIIFMSALADNETLDKITKITNSIKLNKPFKEDLLMQEISKMLLDK